MREQEKLTWVEAVTAGMERLQSEELTDEQIEHIYEELIVKFLQQDADNNE